MEQQRHIRTIKTLHNQDHSLKESFNLFKGGTLEFLDEALSDEVTDILGTEITETTTKKSYGDTALKVSSDKGYHTEYEAEVSEDDVIRFGSNNLDLSRMHKIPFTTIIITTKKPSVTSYSNGSVTFTPKIINLKERDADEVLLEIERKLEAGEPINELIVVYLPLYGSKSGKTTPELLDTVIKLTPLIAKGDEKKQQKLQDLLILLTSTFISEEELNKIWEDNMQILENNSAVKVFGNWGRNQGRQQEKINIALNMLQDGDDYAKVSRNTGLTMERVEELDNQLQAQPA